MATPLSVHEARAVLHEAVLRLPRIMGLRVAPPLAVGSHSNLQRKFLTVIYGDLLAVTTLTQLYFLMYLLRVYHVTTSPRDPQIQVMPPNKRLPYVLRIFKVTASVVVTLVSHE